MKFPKKRIGIVIIASSFRLYRKASTVFGFTEEFFYQRNFAFIVFPLLAAYFAWKQNVSTKKITVASIAILVSVLYINFLPNNNQSDTLILACLHLPLFFMGCLGLHIWVKILKTISNDWIFLDIMVTGCDDCNYTSCRRSVYDSNNKSFQPNRYSYRRIFISKTSASGFSCCTNCWNFLVQTNAIS
jgi:hypothetical protein